MSKVVTMKLDDIARIERGRFSPRPRNDPRYYGGNIPFVQTGDVSRAGTYIQEYSQTLNEEGLAVSKLFPKKTILMTIAANVGDVAILDFDSACPDSLVAFTPKEGVSNKWLFHVLSTMKNKFDSLSTQNAQKNLSLEKIKPVKILVPPYEAQEDMASTFDAWDTAIEKTEALIAAKQKQIQWLVTTLIGKSIYNKVPISSFAREVSMRNKQNKIDLVLSVTNRHGFTLPENQFQRRVASIDTSNYKIVSKSEYAYNPSRINVGSIARLDDWEEGVLSPMYTVFKLDTKSIMSDYFMQWLSSNEAKYRISNCAQGSVRNTVNFNDLCSIDVPLPNIAIQKKIAEIIENAKLETSILTNIVSYHKTQKCGLLNKLLVQKL